MESFPKHLHIISFDVPYPPSYGGAIDVYFKIKAFFEAGIKIHLHCFEYGRNEQPLLHGLCESIKYYPRKTSKLLFFDPLPYIVVSRVSDELIANLLRDQYPILIEGLHDCYYLSDPRMEGRKIIVRTHNIEHFYYSGLAKVEHNIFKKYYFKKESKKLKKFEEVLLKASGVAAISENDTDYFSGKYENATYIPAFHPGEEVDIFEGKGDFVLYHGNLGVGENDEAARFLVTEVFNDIKIPFIIAGSNPSAELIKTVKSFRNIELKANISTEEIYILIKEAQANILPTFQPTGIKLKLLAALYSGRYCIVNTPMVRNTGLEDLCVISDSPAEMKQAVKSLFQKDFTKIEIEKRVSILTKNFSNKINIEKLIRLLF
jgi:glycosyltransferase involved in cell wall biosynthesis